MSQTGWSSYATPSNDPCSPSWGGVTCDSSKLNAMYVQRAVPPTEMMLHTCLEAPLLETES